jgi:hypothetical protein
MPIVDIDNSRQLEFGHGDIEVGWGWLKGENIGVVAFTQRENPNPIGQKGNFEKYQEVELSETPVRMTFEKVESIDVVIWALEEAKKQMLKESI